MVLSLPHGGKLIDQIVRDPIEKARLVKEAQSMVKITIDSAKFKPYSMYWHWGIFST